MSLGCSKVVHWTNMLYPGHGLYPLNKVVNWTATQWIKLVVQKQTIVNNKMIGHKSFADPNK
jgi:hypothetical protein